jgi:hypothetical protein
LIIGAYGADPFARAWAGKSYVVFGKKSSTAINLSDVDSASGVGKGGFVINGEKSSDYSGYSVSSAGDVNGDGLDDVIVGAKQFILCATPECFIAIIALKINCMGNATNAIINIRQVNGHCIGFAKYYIRFTRIFPSDRVCSSCTNNHII